MMVRDRVRLILILNLAKEETCIEPKFKRASALERWLCDGWWWSDI